MNPHATLRLRISISLTQSGRLGCSKPHRVFCLWWPRKPQDSDAPVEETGFRQWTETGGFFHSGTMWINIESSGFVLLDSVLAGGPEGQKPKQAGIQAALSGAGKYKFSFHAKITLKGPCLSWPPWSFWKFDVMDWDTQWLVRLVTPSHLINQEKWRILEKFNSELQVTNWNRTQVKENNPGSNNKKLS